MGPTRDNQPVSFVMSSLRWRRVSVGSTSSSTLVPMSVLTTTSIVANQSMMCDVMVRKQDQVSRSMLCS